MQVAIYGRKLKENVAQYAQKLFDLLNKNNVAIIAYEPFYRHLKKDLRLNIEATTFSKQNDVTKNIDFVISLGGDGTILDAVSWIGEKEIPIIGINFGRLGFLASIPIDDIENAINAILNNQHVIDKRNMVALETNKPLFRKAPFALNEFTVQRTLTSSMITVHTYLDGIHLNSYWADGLIVATATGSTGYSLSCGGPVIYPNSKNFIITPVAPHNLNVRPMVVADDVEIKLTVEGRGSQFITTLDSRNKTIDSSYTMYLRKAKFQAHLVRLSSSNFVNAIREKLLWGEDLRN